MITSPATSFCRTVPFASSVLTVLLLLGATVLSTADNSPPSTTTKTAAAFVITAPSSVVSPHRRGNEFAVPRPVVPARTLIIIISSSSRSSCRASSKSIRSSASAAVTTSFDDLQTDADLVRETAAQALVPVLYPKSDENTLSTTAAHVVEAEKALKRCLRSLERGRREGGQTVGKNGDGAATATATAMLDSTDAAVAAAATATGAVSTTTREERNLIRKELSDLILGTAVMRLRHWYVLHHHHHRRRRKSGHTKKLDNEHRPLVVAEPIIGAEPWMSRGGGAHSEEEVVEVVVDPPDVRLHTVRELVNLHADYVKRHDDDEVEKQPTMSANVAWPSDPIRRLSVRHSLPTFIARLFVTQYGIDAAEEIATLANRPGPVTLRRNSILCGTDEELVRRLWEEGDMRAVTVGNVVREKERQRQQQRQQQQQQKEVDGGETFGSVITNHSNNDSVIVSRLPPPSSLPAPRGCIRLIPDVETGGSKRTSTTTEKAPPKKKKSLWSLGSWQDGWFEVQDVGSQLIVDATEVRCGEVVLDYCAGNGGKTLALASRIWDDGVRSGGSSGGGGSNSSGNSATDIPPGGGRGARRKSRIVAHDVVPDRLGQIRGSLRRAGLLCAGGGGEGGGGEGGGGENSAGTNDTRGATPSCLATVETTCDATSELLGRGILADVVLVDAPCSSLGVLRRRPGQRWALSERVVCQELPELQFGILWNASALVREGGRLVYATCSICREENEAIVDRFERMEGFEDDWERWEFPDDTNGSIGKHCRSLLPHLHDSDGFFISRWKRR